MSKKIAITTNDLRFRYRDGTLHTLSEVAVENGMSPLEFAVVGYLRWCVDMATSEQLLDINAIADEAVTLRRQAHREEERVKCDGQHFNPTIELLLERADWAERYVATLSAIAKSKRKKALASALDDARDIRGRPGYPCHVALVEIFYTKGYQGSLRYQANYHAHSFVGEQHAVYASIMQVEKEADKRAYERKLKEYHERVDQQNTDRPSFAQVVWGSRGS